MVRYRAMLAKPCSLNNANLQRFVKEKCSEFAKRKRPSFADSLLKSGRTEGGTRTLTSCDTRT